MQELYRLTAVKAKVQVSSTDALDVVLSQNDNYLRSRQLLIQHVRDAGWVLLTIHNATISLTDDGLSFAQAAVPPSEKL
jgi:hypothetical protein